MSPILPVCDCGIVSIYICNLPMSPNKRMNTFAVVPRKSPVNPNQFWEKMVLLGSYYLLLFDLKKVNHCAWCPIVYGKMCCVFLCIKSFFFFTALLSIKLSNEDYIYVRKRKYIQHPTYVSLFINTHTHTHIHLWDTLYISSSLGGSFKLLFIIGEDPAWLYAAIQS